MKLLNTAVGLLGARFLGRPFYARFHVTHRCNHRCRMCALHTLADASKELDTEGTLVVARRLAELGARHVVITGGEPLLRPDIAAIVRHFAGEGFSVRIQTNGGPHVTRDLLSACAEAGLQDLSVSLDTLDRPLQDDICQGRNVVDNALRTLRLAREILPRGISQANIVASRYNFEELPSLVRTCRDMGVYAYVTAVMLGGGRERADEYLFRASDPGFALEGLDPAVRDRVIDELVALRRDGGGITNSTRYLEDFRTYLATGHCDWRCEAGTLCLDVHPDGGVTVCKEKPPVANILDPGFVAFYRSAEFRRLATDTAKRCTGCFYGEYREPRYAIRDLSVLGEWIRDWFVTFRRGMRRSSSRPEPIKPAAGGAAPERGTATLP